MLDKIVIMRSTNTAMLIFTDKAPVTIWPGDKPIDEFILWYLSSPGENVVSLPDRHHGSDIELTTIMAKAG